MADMRKESDSLGVVEVPADRLWGASVAVIDCVPTVCRTALVKTCVPLSAEAIRAPQRTSRS